MIPNFRNDVEAARFAEAHQPLRNALQFCDDEEYVRRYGLRARNAANRCRLAAAKGNSHGLHIAGLSLSIVLHQDRPQLFDKVKRL